MAPPIKMSELSVIATVLFITVSFQSCLAFFSQSYYNNSHALAGDISKRFQVALLINATVRSKNWQAGKINCLLLPQSGCMQGQPLAHTHGIALILSGLIRVVYEYPSAK